MSRVEDYDAHRDHDVAPLLIDRGLSEPQRRIYGPAKMRRLLHSVLLFAAGVITGTLLVKLELGTNLTSPYFRWMDGQVPATPHLDPFQVVPAGKNSSVGLLSLLWGNGTRHAGHAVKAGATETSLYERSLRLMERYARLHGYPMWVGRHVMLEGPQKGKMTGMWTKQALMLSVMLDELRKPEDERLSWLFFLDADSVILNPNVPLETFLPPDTAFGRNQTLIASVDPWKTLNAGSFLIRISQDGLRILATILAHPFLRDNVHGEWGNGEQTSTAWIYANKHFLDKVAAVPLHWINADGLQFSSDSKIHPKTYQPGDLLIHFMGGVKTGWEEYLEQAEKRNATLMPPLEQTRYVSGNDTVALWWKSWEATPRDERHKILVQASKGQD